MINKFWFGGLCSSDYGIIITEAPADVMPARDVQEIEIPGRSGSLTMDNGRYKDIEMSLKCALLPWQDSRTYREQVLSVATFLASTANFRKLITSYDENHYRMARIKDGMDIETIAEQAGQFEIAFKCKPQRFLRSGETPIVLDRPTAIINKTHFSAEPYIKVYGSGAGELSISGVTVEIKELAGYLELDAETQNAYKGPENMNAKIYAPAFPALKPGKSSVSWTGGIERVEIVPRWWTL